MAGQPIDEVGDVVDTSLLGHGGFGDVFVGREVTLQRQVAIKVLRIRPDETTLRSFDREVAALAKLGTHPNIVTLHRAGLTSSGFPYLVMEYASGGSLAARLGEQGPLPWSEAVQIIREAAKGLSEAHRHGIRHRDIKPGNIFISAHGVPLLGDFGIATVRDQTVTSGASITASLSHASPEQVAGQKVDERSDVYSLASTLYELISGSPALVRADDDLVATIARIATEPPPSLPSAVPQHVRDAISAAMDKDPDRRPATAAEFSAMLEDEGVSDRTIVVPAHLATTAGVGGAAAGADGLGESDVTRNVAVALAAERADSKRRIGAVLIGLGVIAVAALGFFALSSRGSSGDGDATRATVTNVEASTPPAPPVSDPTAAPPASPIATESVVTTTPVETTGVPTTVEPAPPTRAGVVSVTADDGYEMFINGELVSASWMAAETFELPLVAGPNVIGLRVAALSDSTRGVAARLELDSIPESGGRLIEPGEWMALPQLDPGIGWLSTELDAVALGWRPAIASAEPPSGAVDGLGDLTAAHWAWFDNDANAGHLRLVVDAPEAEIARFTVTASSAYGLHVNDVDVLFGASLLGRDTRAVDLGVGRNVVGLKVINMIGPGGVAAEVTVGDTRLVTTNATWRISSDAGTESDLAWTTVDYSDAEMLSATEYGALGAPETIWAPFNLWPDDPDVRWIWRAEDNSGGPESVLRDRDERLFRREFNVSDEE